MNQQYIATMNQNLIAPVNFSDEQIMEQYNRALMVPVEEDEQSAPIYDIYDIIDGADIECGIQEEKEDTEENAYGLEGEYKTDFEAWKRVPDGGRIHNPGSGPGEGRVHALGVLLGVYGPGAAQRVVCV